MEEAEDRPEYNTCETCGLVFVMLKNYQGTNFTRQGVMVFGALGLSKTFGHPPTPPPILTRVATPCYGRCVTTRSILSPNSKLGEIREVMREVHRAFSGRARRSQDSVIDSRLHHHCCHAGPPPPTTTPSSWLTPTGLTPLPQADPLAQHYIVA